MKEDGNQSTLSDSEQSRSCTMVWAINTIQPTKILDDGRGDEWMQ